MGVMTLAEFRADVTAAVSRGTLDTTRLDRWINQSLREFAHALKFRELEKTVTGNPVAGVSVVPLPADFRAYHEEGVWIQSPEEYIGPLKRTTRRQYIKQYSADVSARGIISEYHIYGKNLYFSPVPDTTVLTWLLHYWAQVTPFVGVNDTSQFDPDWDDIIFTGALYRGYRHYGEFDRYQNVRNDFLGMIRSRIESEDLEPFPEGGISVVGPNDVEADL